MGREARRVPADWEHPKDDTGNFTPLLEGPFSQRLSRWTLEKSEWDRGNIRDYSAGFDILAFKPKDSDHNGSYEDWNGEEPRAEDYMPEFAPGEATHYQMYETTSEGTPISTVFTTPEELARWLTDTDASAFGHMTASYDGWLATILGGGAMSAVVTVKDGRSEMRSGVEAMKDVGKSKT